MIGINDENCAFNKSIDQPRNSAVNVDSPTINSLNYSPLPNISIEYPQILNTTDEKVNKMIQQFVENILQDLSAPEDYSIQLTYDIKHFNESFLSITFQGFWNDIIAAHPIDYFNALTIDLQNNKVISLTDLYHIDQSFVNTVRQKFKDQAADAVAEKTFISSEQRYSVEDELDKLDDKFLQELLKTSYPYFLTDKAVGISISISHAIGDHVEIYVDNQDILTSKKQSRKYITSVSISFVVALCFIIAIVTVIIKKLNHSLKNNAHHSYKIHLQNKRE